MAREPVEEDDSDSDDLIDVSKFTPKQKSSKNFSDNIADAGESIRMSNRHKGGALLVDTVSGAAIQGNSRDTFSSPSYYLRGEDTPSRFS